MMDMIHIESLIQIQARKNNNPEELLNQTVNGFNPQQKQKWQQIMEEKKKI